MTTPMMPPLLPPNDPNAAVDRVKALMTLGGGAGGGAAAPPAPNLAGRLLPAPEAENFLDPNKLQQLRSLALMQEGAQIMGGARGPQGTLNLGRDVAGALQGGQQDFQQMTDRMMQQRQWEMQYGALQDLHTAMGPPGASAGGGRAEGTTFDPMTLQANAANLRALATRIGLFLPDQAKVLLSAAEGMTTQADQIKPVDTVDANGNPVRVMTFSGQPVLGADGKPVQYALPPMSMPEQLRGFHDDMSPYEKGAGLWTSYQQLIGRDDPTSLASKAELLARMIEPQFSGSLQDLLKTDSPLAAVPGFGKLLAAMTGEGKIDPRLSGPLDDAAMGQARAMQANSARQAGISQRMWTSAAPGRRTPLQPGDSQFVDPFFGLTIPQPSTGGGAPGGPPAAGGRYRMMLGADGKLRREPTQ